MSPRTKITTTSNSNVILLNYPFKKSFLNQKLQLHNNNHCFNFVSLKIARLKVMKLKMKKRELNSSSWVFLTSSRQCDINSYYKLWFDGDNFNTKSSSKETTKSSSNWRCGYQFKQRIFIKLGNNCGEYFYGYFESCVIASLWRTAYLVGVILTYKRSLIFKFRDTCITKFVIIIGILEKVIPNNKTVVS